MSLFTRGCKLGCPYRERLREAEIQIRELQDIIDGRKSKGICFVKDPDGHPEYDCHNHHKWSLT